MKCYICGRTIKVGDYIDEIWSGYFDGDALNCQDPVFAHSNCLKRKDEILRDLEHLKTLLEKYKKGERPLADAWDFINDRIEYYMKGG